MEQLIAKLRQLLEEAQAVIHEHRGKLQEVNAEAKRLQDMGASLESRHQDLNARESSVKHVENVLDLHKKATLLHDQAHQRLQDAQEAEKALKLKIETSTQELNNKKELIRREDLAVEKKKKAVDDLVEARVKEVLAQMGLKKDSV